MTEVELAVEVTLDGVPRVLRIIREGDAVRLMLDGPPYMSLPVPVGKAGEVADALKKVAGVTA